MAGCRILARIIHSALSGMEKEELLQSVPPSEWMSPRFLEIAGGGFREKTRDQIRGSGYVVDSLDAALWSFWTTSSFEEAILTAANLGDDADTTAAVCGQVAGAYYGRSGIPERWLERVWEGERIGEVARRLSGVTTAEVAGAEPGT